MIRNDEIYGILADIAGVDAGILTEETRLVADLGLTSFDLSDIVVNLEDEYDVKIPDSMFPEIQTVGDVLRVVREVQENGSVPTA